MSKSNWQLPGIQNKVRRAICAHKRVAYGPMRDICYDCLAILDEHPNGRSRPSDERPWLTIHGLEQAHRGNGLPDHIPGTYEGRCPCCPSNERVPEGDTE